MHSEIPSFNRCCFCAPLRYGLLVWAYLKLVFNIIFFAGALIWLSFVALFIFMSSNAVYIVLMIAFVLLFVFFDIVFCFVLIVGGHKKHTTLLRLYYRYGIVHAVLLTALGFVSVGISSASIEDILQRPDEWHYILVLSAIYSSFLILHVYLMLLVRSEVRKLKANGEFRFVNHTADPTCAMQTIDFPPTVKNNG
ncbi:unnamed protein product, partial [Iphiclides podalirius]